MRKKKRLLDEYRFPGFRPKAEIKGIFGDVKERVIRLVRSQKQEYARLKGKDRSFIKGHKYTLLSNWQNLTIDGSKALKKQGIAG